MAGYYDAQNDPNYIYSLDAGGYVPITSATVLGGGNGGMPPANTNSGAYTQSNLSPEQQQILRAFIDSYSRYIGGGLAGYEGSGAAGVGSTAYAGINEALASQARLGGMDPASYYANIPNAASYFANLPSVPDTSKYFKNAKDPGVNPLTPLSYASLGKYLSGEYSSNPYLENFYKSNIEEPLVKKFTDETIPGLMGNYATKGLLYGSGREVGRREESKNLMDTMTKGRSDLLYNMWTQAQANQLAASETALGYQNSDTARYLANIDKAYKQGQLSLSEYQAALSTAQIKFQSELGLSQAKFGSEYSVASDLAKYGMGIGQMMVGVGGMETQQEQAGMDFAYNQWLRNQPGTMPTDQLLLSILGLSTTDTVVPPGKAANNDSANIASVASTAVVVAAAAY